MKRKRDGTLEEYRSHLHQEGDTWKMLNSWKEISDDIKVKNKRKRKYLDGILLKKKDPHYQKKNDDACLGKNQ